MDWVTFLIVIGCLLVSAFFAASETALTGASRASMLRLSKQGNQDAAIVSSLSALRERLIGALLLGNNIANIGASALATGIFTEMVRRSRSALRHRRHDGAGRDLRRGAAEDHRHQCAGPGGAPGGAADEGHGVSARAAAQRRRGRRSRADEADRRQHRPQPADPVAVRAVARRGRSASPRGQGRKAGPRHVRRATGPA